MIKDYEQDIKVSNDILKLGGVILYPTDTIWGLGCDAMNEQAIEKLFKIKHRDAKKSFVLLMTDVKQLSNFIANPLPDLESILSKFTEPTTIIYEQAINLPSSVLGEDGSVAVRITNDPFCRSLIKRFRQPIVSTSANISGEPSPIHFSLITNTIKEHVDYVVHWRQDDISTKQPSTILKLSKDGRFTKIR
jgi:L-threonylcarbamoyladenylate synthase